MRLLGSEMVLSGMTHEAFQWKPFSTNCAIIIRWCSVALSYSEYIAISQTGLAPVPSCSSLHLFFTAKDCYVGFERVGVTMRTFALQQHKNMLIRPSL
eukprot:7996560-Ditylum_brightwellii.AAC.1